ncbi:MAG: DUF4191 domain-containing protein [Arcanobacterium sp.]|nr:DUF4191 domain-containing protein [Arcanobacterium sp.]MDY5588811.1 DUF4191 family protein [Arcanobacterium sp.]
MDKEEKARLKAARKAAKKNKTPWYRNFIDAYKLVVKVFPWARFVVWGSLALFLILGIVIGAVTGHWISWILTGVALAVLAPLITLTVLVSKAAYRQADGVPGAAGGVLSQLGRGWVTKEEPVEFSRDMKNFVFRAVGKPGVVLVAEGPGDLSPMMRSAAKQVNRTVASAPVVTLYVGHGPKQIKLEKLKKTIMRLPRTMTAREVADTAQRLDAVQTHAMPIPKGMDPAKMHMATRSRVR